MVSIDFNLFKFISVSLLQCKLMDALLHVLISVGYNNYKSMVKYCCTLVINCVAVLAFAQNNNSDSALKLPTVFIKSLRLESLNKSTVIQNITPIELQSRQGSSMAEVLQENTPVFIRNYGSGGLATASFRGSNAYHTPVIWNGINIQNPMNGQIDFSSIPVFLSDEINLQYGGNGGVWGSGAIGGLLFINNQNTMKQKAKVELLTSAINYGVFQNGFKVSFKVKKLFSSTKAFNNFGTNNFEYEYQNKRFYQNNAQLQNSGFQQVLSFTKNTKNSFTGLVWFNQSNNQIAPNINASNSNAMQQDKNLRTALTWQNNIKNSNTEIKLAYFYDEIIFESKSIQAATSKSYTYNLLLERTQQFNNKINLHFGLVNWLAFANVDGYEKAVNQNRLAAFVYIKKESKNSKFQQQLGVRKELVNADFIPFMPSYYLQCQIKKNVVLKFNTAATYRLPTFNDLYWKNGGNLNLQSENGWGSDFALNYLKYLGPIHFDLTTSFFYKTTDNYIQWIPINSAIFSPINIGNVTARGIELIIKSRCEVSAKSGVQFNYVGSFLQAIDTKTEQQLIFTPRIKHVFNVIYNYQKLTIKYNHTYTGVSYTKSDLSEWNNDFEIGNLSISKTINFNNQNDLNIQLGINNIWNKSYQVMPDRPMPLRNFQLTLQYSITKK